MTEFNREHRYIVIKLSDMPKASLGVQAHFNAGYRALREDMYSSGVKDREYLVIERDWPEYEPTWRAIEARVTGSAQKVAAEGLPEPVGLWNEAENRCHWIKAVVGGKYDAMPRLVRLDAVEPLAAGLRAELEEAVRLGKYAAACAMESETRHERERDALRAEVELLKGLRPDLPPRPPEGDGLPRYGLRWNGPGNPLAVPMDDGYWTPWHLADTLRTQNAELVGLLQDLVNSPHKVMIPLELWHRIDAALSAYEGREGE